MDGRSDSPRWQKRFEVLLRCNGEQKIGYMTNLSNEGMEVRTRYRLNMNDEVSMRVITFEGEKFHYLSEVRWWRPVHGRKMSLGIFRFGLKHLAVDPEHARLVEMVKYDGPRRNGSRRYPIDLPVQVANLPELGDLHTDNLSEGGLFLKIEGPPPPYRDERVSLRLTLPDAGEPISVDAKVVHLIQPLIAEKLDLSTGVGLRFIKLDAEAHQKIQALVRDLEAKQPKPDPEAADNDEAADILDD